MFLCTHIHAIYVCAHACMIVLFTSYIYRPNAPAVLI